MGQRNLVNQSKASCRDPLILEKALLPCEVGGGGIEEALITWRGEELRTNACRLRAAPQCPQCGPAEMLVLVDFQSGLGADIMAAVQCLTSNGQVAMCTWVNRGP